MRVLIAAFGSVGDVHPLLGIGRALAARGHSVVICANPVFESLVERCGLAFRAVGSKKDYLDALGDPALWSPRTSLRTLWTAMAREMRPLFDLVAREAGGDTVAIGSLWAFGARLAQEKLGLPYLSAQVSPSTLLSAALPPVHPRFGLPRAMPVTVNAACIRLIEFAVLDRIFGPALNGLRRELGLAPVDRIMSRWMHSPQGVLGLFPDWFAPRQDDWPGAFCSCGFPLFDGADLEPETLDGGLCEFLQNGPPPVVVTPGSTALHGPGFFRAAVQALQAMGHRAVLLGADALALGELPASMLVRRYVPISLLLPHGAALLHHAGIGTSALGLAAGVPQVVTPFAHDQFDNAARLQRLGVGATVARPSPVALEQALTRVLGDPAIAQACLLRRRHVESPAAARSRVVAVVEALRPAACISLQGAPAHVDA